MRRTSASARSASGPRRPARRHLLTVERLEATIGQLADDDKLQEALEAALSQVASRCDRAMTDYLLGLDDPKMSHLLDSVATSWRSEDGNDLISFAIIASSGREEKEEVVRALVKRWGPRTSHALPSSPWSPLHFAALLSTPPLISFVLNQGYPPSVTTARSGLTALDIISDMPHRQEAVTLLRHAEQALEDTRAEVGGDTAAASSRRQSLLDRRRANKLAADERAVERARRDKRRAEQDACMVEQMHAAGMEDGIEYLLNGTRRRWSGPDGNDSSRESDSDLTTDDDDDDDDDNAPSEPPGSATAPAMTIFDEMQA